MKCNLKDVQHCSGTMNLDRFLKEIKLIGGSYTFSTSPEKLMLLSIKVNNYRTAGVYNDKYKDRINYPDIGPGYFMDILRDISILYPHLLEIRRKAQQARISKFANYRIIKKEMNIIFNDGKPLQGFKSYITNSEYNQIYTIKSVGTISFTFIDGLPAKVIFIFNDSGIKTIQEINFNIQNSLDLSVYTMNRIKAIVKNKLTIIKQI